MLVIFKTVRTRSKYDANTMQLLHMESGLENYNNAIILKDTLDYPGNLDEQKSA